MHRNWLIRVLMPMEAIIASGILLGLAAAATGPDRAILIAVWIGAGLVLPAAIAFGLQLRTAVTDQRLVARFVPFARKSIDLADIESAEAIKYSPLMDAGGWGIRLSRKFGLVLNVSGEHGVHIRYRKNGKPKQLLIGSERSYALADAITEAQARTPTTPTVREVPVAMGPVST